MDNYRAIRAVQAYVDDFTIAPESNWPPYLFKKRSYEIFAANKILGLIASSGGIPAQAVINDFIDLLRCRPDHKELDLLFSTMLDVARDIDDILRAMD